MWMLHFHYQRFEFPWEKAVASHHVLQVETQSSFDPMPSGWPDTVKFPDELTPKNIHQWWWWKIFTSEGDGYGSWLWSSLLCVWLKLGRHDRGTVHWLTARTCRVGSITDRWYHQPLGTGMHHKHTTWIVWDCLFDCILLANCLNALFVPICKSLVWYNCVCYIILLLVVGRSEGSRKGSIS